MLHLLRLVCLLISAGAGFVAWTYHAKPEWVFALDTKLTARHMEEIERVVADVQLDSWDRNWGQLEDRLESWSSVQLGDRRLPDWSFLVQRLIGGLHAQGDLDRALAWQKRLVIKNPRDPRLDLAWVRLLMERRSAADLELAQARLSALRNRLPDWKELLPVQIELADARRDWPSLIMHLREWVATGDELSHGWQWFSKYQQEGRLGASDLVDAERVVADEGQALVNRFRLVFRAPQGKSIHGLRVDPPGIVGALQRVQFFQLDGDDVVVRELDCKRVADAEWDPSRQRLRLTGAKDPRITLDLNADLPTAVEVRFEAVRELPDWVWERSESDAGLAEQLAREGWKPSNMERRTGGNR